MGMVIMRVIVMVENCTHLGFLWWLLPVALSLRRTGWLGRLCI
jgi:hypothetical protein